MTTKIYITLKPGVLDTQGQAVANTLHRLGFTEVAEVRIGKYLELTTNGELDRNRIEEMCKKLLANTVIENYHIESGG